MGLEIVDVVFINKGSILYKFSIKMTTVGITIKDCLYISSNGNEFFKFPSREYESEGQKKYFSYIYPEPETKAVLDKKVKEYFDSLKANR